MKKTIKTKSGQMSDRQLYVGCQWGEPPHGESSFPVIRVGRELEITGALPDYFSRDHPCDLIRQYEIHNNRSIGNPRMGKDSPHIRFANADSDDELIDFVRTFGPVVSKSWKMLPFTIPPGSGTGTGELPIQLLMTGRQNLSELRGEQRIYKAALGLLVELAKKPAEYDVKAAKQRMSEIAHDIADWPRQWNREKKERGGNPLWRARGDALRRVTALAKSEPDRLLPPQVDARIVLCELVNVFPSLAFPNPLEMHSYIRFGIRPLLYSILTREFLQPRDVAICSNTQCRDFFKVQRAGQRFCNDVCSRQQRQRDYWQSRGKRAERKDWPAKARVEIPKPLGAELPVSGD